VLSAIIPPFKKPGVEAETRVLFDGPTSGAERASLVLITTTGNIEIWPHRHPSGAELVYVLEGAAKVRGTALTWTDLKAGDAVYLPPGVAHGWWWNGSKTKPARLLFLYSPPGPELALRELGGADSTLPLSAAEVKKPNVKGPQPMVRASAAASSYIIAQSKGLVRMSFDSQSALDGRGYVGTLHGDPGMVVADHTHDVESEFFYITKGRGEATLDGVTVSLIPGMAIHFPPRHRHSLKVLEPLEAVQFYAPSGPEKRFKAPAK
jgi:quercetin dioxygenase-like cupin family protein